MVVDPRGCDYGSRRIWSLLDLMNNVNVPLVLWTVHEADVIITLMSTMKMQGNGGAPVGAQKIVDLLKTIALLKWHLHNKSHGLEDFERACEVVISDLRKPLLDVSTVHAVLMTFKRSLIECSEDRVFAIIDADFSSYVNNEKSFGEDTYKNFPSAREDIKQAGNCIAVECWTAAVFHLMRAVEFGLRALSHDRGITVPKGPIELATWEDMIRELEKAETEIQSYPKTLEREGQFEFFHGSMMEVKRFKNKFRNAVMHTREDYDADEAKSAFIHVKAFFGIISIKISETTTTPRVWT
jgi:hypothetical protein